MPIAENTGSAAGPVTRSLRKRLTSVDSESSSRPATPVFNNLQAIQETVTPSKRITRRTSFSTPITTPSKVSNTPGRRSTRRQSLLAHEQEDSVVQAKSKEPSVDGIKEEEPTNQTPEAQNRRVTRSSSKSPLELSAVKSKFSSKFTNENTTENCDIGNNNHDEVINISDDEETSPLLKTKKHAKVMIKNEKNIDEMLVNQTTPFKANLSSDHKTLTEHASPVQTQTKENSPEKIGNTENKKSLENVSTTDGKSSPSNTSLRPEKSQKDSGKINSSLIVQLNPMKAQAVESPHKKISKESLHSEEPNIEEQNVASVKNLKNLESSPRKSLEKKKLSLGQASPSMSPCKKGTPLNKSRPDKLKSVGFKDSIGEDSVNSVFPKTPCSTKSKSYILDKSKNDEEDTSHEFVENETSHEFAEKETSHEFVEKETSHESVQTETSHESVKEEISHESIEKEASQTSVLNDPEKLNSELENQKNNGDHDETQNVKTPYKLKLKAVESSTPIQSDSPKKIKEVEVENTKEDLVKTKEEPVDVFQFSKSWICSVSGKASEMPKIDKITPEKNSEEAADKLHSLSSENRSKDRRYDFDEDMEDEGEEEEFQEKSDFIDDEAMEVPEGEESMDSEERIYLEENEVPVRCESIGSQDTDQDDDDDEPDDEDLAFIVSDSEELIQELPYNDSEDEIGEKPSEKKYRRIVQMSDSSNESHELVTKGTSTKFKLNVGSSDDEEQNGQINKDSDDKTVNKIEIKTRTSEISMADTMNKNKQLNTPHKEENQANSLEVGEKLNQSKQKRVSETENQSGNKTQNIVMLDKNVHILSEAEMGEGGEATSSPTKSPKKSRNSLNKSKLEVSRNLSATDSCQEVADKSHNSQTSALSPHQKSFNESKLDSENDNVANKNYSLEKSNVSGQDPRIGFPAKDLNASKKMPRKSFNKSTSESLEREEFEFSKEIMNKSLKIASPALNRSEQVDKLADEKTKSVPVENETDDDEPSLDVSQDKKDRKQSLNVSKNKKSTSLIRSSTEEMEENEEQSKSLHKRLNKSNLEKSFPSLEVSFESDETPPSPNTARGSLAEKSLNLSKTSQRSKLYSKVDEIHAIGKEKQKNETDFVRLRRNSSAERKDRKVAPNSESSSSNEREQEKKTNDSESSNDECVDARFSEAEEDDQPKKSTERSMFMEFFGEEDIELPELSSQPDLNSTRRSIAEKSKLDETFELDSRHTSRSDNLHKSIMRKSLIHNQLQRCPIEEDTNKADTEVNKSKSSLDSSEEEEVVVSKKVPGERGLSMSLSSTDARKKTNANKIIVHNSFTIGVSVRKGNSVEVNPKLTVSSDSEETESECALSEAEELEKVKNVQRIGPYKPNKSLLFKAPSPTPDETKKQNKIKRTSFYQQKEDLSQSFIENITEEKKKIESKRKRKSNSFCGVLAPPAESENTIQPEKVKSETKHNPKSSSESESTTDIRHILHRCDEILEAANHAKREAKLNAKKSKVKKPKWMDKEERNVKEEEDIKIPLVSRKEIKRKEKLKKELAKAIKHSTAMLRTIDPKLGKKLKISQEIGVDSCENNNNVISTKRLPLELLDALEEGAPKPKIKKTKEIESTPPSDRENSKKHSNKQAHTISDHRDGKKKKKREPKLLETAAGTVVVEPSTPEKLRYQHGFRESPKTPAGFKIQNIHSAGQNKKDKDQNPFRRKLYTTSGEFIEKDSSMLSTAKSSATKEKSRKRKRYVVDEPVYSLPKTQWTTSGVFVEEDLFTPRPLANSTATQFMIASLNGSKKMKNSTKPVSVTSQNSAMNFKQNALLSANRETSRDLLHRKQRKLVNKQY